MSRGLGDVYKRQAGNHRGKLKRWWRWAGDAGRARYCAACVRRCRKRGKPAPCGDCDKREPPLLDANIPAARLACASGTQWRVGFGGPYGLDYPAVFAVARALGITMDADTLNGVALIERTQLELWNREKH